MPDVNEQDLALGGVYAQAIWDAASAQQRTDAVLGELLDLAAYLRKQPDFEGFLSSPTIDTDAKRSLIEKVLRGKYSDLFVDALQVINRNERLGQFAAIAEAYRQLNEERTGRVEVFVRSAHPLTEAHRSRLREVTSKQTGREVDLVESRDDSLLGGMIVQINDDRYDMSVARRLRDVYHSLLERASREIHSGRSYVEGVAT